MLLPLFVIWPLRPHLLPVIALNLLLQLHQLLSLILSGLLCSPHLLGLHPALPRARRHVHPLQLRFLLALVTFWILLHLDYVARPLESIASGERGWQVAGRKPLVREGLEHPTGLKPFLRQTDSIVCSSVRGLLDLESTTLRDLSLLQLAGLRGRTLSATAFHQRLSAGHTSKARGWFTLCPSIRSNGNYKSRRFGEGLHALRAGDHNIRFRGGWEQSMSGFGCNPEAVRSARSCTCWIFPRRVWS